MDPERSDQRSGFEQAVVDIVDRIVKSGPADGKKSLQVLAAIRALPDVEVVSEVELHMNEYWLVMDAPSRHRELADILNAVGEYRLTVAPEVTAIVGVEQYRSLMISRYTACAGEKLAPVRPNRAQISALAEERFLKDMRTLVDHRLLHEFAARGTAHWWMSSRSGTIVLDDWYALVECGADRAGEAMADLEQIFRWRRAGRPV